MGIFRKGFAVGLLFVSLASSVSMAKDPIDVWYDNCMNHNQTDAGMRGCTYKAMQMWNRKLNTIYRELMAKLPPKDKKELRESEMAWINYKKHFLNVDSDTCSIGGGGEICFEGVDADDLDITKRQAKLLEELLDNLEGNP